MLAVLIGKVKSFSKEIYQNAMAKLDLHSLACSCGHAGCLTVHGYYTRKVRDQNGFFLVNIMRVKCKECGRTHALLPEALVPYSQIPVDIQRDILLFKIGSDEMENLLLGDSAISVNDIYRVRAKYRAHWKERVITACASLRIEIEELLKRCYAEFKMQFMQIRRGIYLRGGTNHIT
jgi:hypothetical protein